MEKALRIVWATGEVDENGNPVTRRQTISVSPNATAQDLANAVNTSTLSRATLTFPLSSSRTKPYEEVKWYEETVHGFLQ